MALARIARSNLRRSGGTIGNNYTSERYILCEGLSTHKSSLPSHKNVTADGNLSYLSSIKRVNHMSFWSRGISVTPQYQCPAAPERIAEESDFEYDNPKYPGLEAMIALSGFLF